MFPILNPLPPPSPYHPSGSSQRTSPKHLVSCIEPRLAIRFLHDSIHVSMLFSQIIPPSSSPTESKSLFYTSVFLVFFFFFPTEHTYSQTLQKLLLGKIECLSLQMLPACKLFFCFLSQCFILLKKRRKGTFFLRTISTQIVYTLQV